MPVGAKVYDDQGNLVVEIGGHILGTRPCMLAEVGQVAAEWAQSEAELARCLATLMDTSPDRTFALLNAYKSASSTADAARALARVTLNDVEVEEFDRLISDFKAAAEERNKIQHALWALKPSHPDSLFRVKSVDYMKFTVRLIAADDKVSEATKFSNHLTDEYDVARLTGVVEQIKLVTGWTVRLTNAQLVKRPH